MVFSRSGYTAWAGIEIMRNPARVMFEGSDNSDHFDNVKDFPTLTALINLTISI